MKEQEKETRKKMNEALSLNLTHSFISEKITFSQKYFQKFLRDSRIAKKTLKNYIGYLKQFANWIEINDIKNPTRDDIRSYQRYLDSLISNKTGKALEETTKQQYFQVVKTFFQFLENEKLYEDITRGIKSFRIDKTEERKRAFSPNEINKLLESIDTTTQKGLRDYSMLILTFTGGLRSIELQRANIEDIEIIDNQPILWIQGKGHKTKNDYVKLIPELEQSINEYLKTRPNAKKSDPLFTSTSNRSREQRFDETSISRLFKNLFKKAGFNSKKITCHSLRHSSNFILYEMTGDIEKVRQHARHKDISSSQIYVNHSERKNNNFEQEIYNAIVKKDCDNERKELLDEITRLSDEDIKRIVDFIKNIKEESI